jgi:hypothetical protein
MASDQPRCWIAVIWPNATGPASTLRYSQRLHWTQRAARDEVEAWVRDMRLRPVRWEMIDDLTAIGRIGEQVMVFVGTTVLPEGEPPPADTG